MVILSSFLYAYPGRIFNNGPRSLTSVFISVFVKCSKKGEKLKTDASRTPMRCHMQRIGNVLHREVNVMARPHMVVYREIKDRIRGKSGSARISELRKVLAELPGYKSGPYADIRNWVLEQIDKTKTASKIKHQDWIGVRKEGEAQIALVGPPNTGKSSLVKELTGIQIKIADYAFTTLKPIPAIMKLKDVEIQLIDFPGLIEGAYEDRGGGRRLLGIIREINGIIYVHDATRDPSELRAIINEVKKAGISRPSVILFNKIDLVDRKKLDEMIKEFPDFETVPISVKIRYNIERVKEIIWSMSGLMRVFTKDGQSVALKRGSTVRNFAEKIHKEFLENFKSARIWGPSAKFDGQTVGLDHVLEDDDRVEIHTKR